ncbi:PREDICTED: uncharacterized protein LOC109157416 [Ipomoea nil]|uniref:uncharacterized protein LOC109157416 n=1 Tax=Ipomoea nil TaxID=35883 RepID=UPI000901D123|nr:PREDICTED: uncharacterized protein LOC109157416 [Ipomoea nil]
MLSWNCQGAASASFRRILKQFLRLHKPSLVCLFESKVSGAQANEICSSFGFDEWIRVESVGYSGGIWLFWNDTLSIEILYTHPQFISFQVTEIGSLPWLMSAVYGSPNLALRRRLFADLSGQFFEPQGPWLTVGDFNSITNRSEVNGSESFTLSRCSAFNSWIFREGLVDLGYSGSIYTWMRGIDTPSFKGARLDCALCNIEWNLRFSAASVTHLPMIGSDHSPCSFLQLSGSRSSIGSGSTWLG